MIRIRKDVRNHQIALLTRHDPCDITTCPIFEGELMKAIRRLFAALVVAAFLFHDLNLQAQVLNQVPEQALVVVKVNNLQGFSVKLGKLCTDLQIVAQLPPLADPLAALQDKLKLQNGLDKAGEAAFAFLDPAVAGGNDDDSF